MQRDESITSFVSDCFFLFEDIQDVGLMPASRAEWIVLLLCENGIFQINVNSQPYTLRKNDLAFCTPDSIIEKAMMSPDFRGCVFGCSETFIKRSFPNSADIWYKVLYLKQNFKVDLTDGDVEELHRDYLFIKDKIQQTDNAYYEEMIRCFLQGIMFHFAHMLNHLINTVPIAEALQSKELICRSFIDLLAASSPKPRSVGWYSERLHVTPKYLSVVIKDVSGRTASEWIRDAVISDISDLLKNSMLSVKEICDKLDFPTLSFFGRYVRRHLGVSPTKYRASIKLKSEENSLPTE